MAASLPVSEIFGPTVQGEGPYAGRVAAFLRLGGCNLRCVWCDTRYSWDAETVDLRTALTSMTSTEIAEALPDSTPIVVVTGGEPFLHARSAEFAELLRMVRNRGQAIHVESNGTIFPPPDVLELLSVVILSPKLDNAADSRRPHDAHLADGWRDVARLQEVHLKVVCVDEADVWAAAELAAELGWPRERVWVMPEGTTRERLDARWPAIVDAAISAGVNATQRLHVLAWGDEPGR